MDTTTIYDDGWYYDIPENPPASEVDLEAIRELISDQSLIYREDIEEICGLKQGALFLPQRAMENYVRRGHRQWPPEREVRKEVVGEGGEGRELVALPPLPSVLPVPAVLAAGGSGRHRWYRGEVIHWGMRTGRLDPDGTVATRSGGESRAFRAAKLVRRRKA